jgi:hypothetical protein
MQEVVRLTIEVVFLLCALISASAGIFWYGKDNSKAAFWMAFAAFLVTK